MYPFFSYLKFLWSSTNEHGVHSPFVYSFLTLCLYNTKKDPAYKTLQAYRKDLKNNSKTIQVTDFGAGSRVFKSNTRAIAAIAKNAGINFKRQKTLYRIVQYLKCTSILELGTSVGIATSALALNNKNATVTTIEGCKEIAATAKYYFSKYGFQNISCLNTDFNTYFASKKITPLDLVYIDGDHTKKGTLDNFNALLPYVKNNTILIFDDIYWSKEMTEAWTQIHQNPNVTVSIDTYFWGIVFFRKEQRKQHFKIRM